MPLLQQACRAVTRRTTRRQTTAAQLNKQSFMTSGTAHEADSILTVHIKASDKAQRVRYKGRDNTTIATASAASTAHIDTPRVGTQKAYHIESKTMRCSQVDNSKTLLEYDVDEMSFPAHLACDRRHGSKWSISCERARTEEVDGRETQCDSITSGECFAFATGW